ncbi:hypothetical protein KC19_VG327200 [Ceratodon purpureus]|uniref:Uncharacterized protein n=1 Tax=Ceratodon purpureus TaxID=3225 RepID=A0A8T0HWV5_CERPU|nr:hypothetical protein KC19_VG327200 [Ceratodon purpureus]KAG0575210.1 hypothetical protein KC19_VG327200 [Ceratodon purpureus]
MSSSTWEDRATPAQTSPPDSYHPDQPYAHSDHDSRKGCNDDPGTCNYGYASPPSLPRYYSDQGSVHDNNRVKGHGSIPHSHHGSVKDFPINYGGSGGGNGGDYQGSVRLSGSRNGSHHSSVKDFGSDHGSGHSHFCSYLAKNEAKQDNNSVTLQEDFVRPSMSWLDRRSFHMGESCAVPLNWKYHPTLRQVPPEEQQNYRHAKIEEWLSTSHKRKPKENFGAYLWRASALANSELTHRKKQCWGDDYRDPLDRFVMRLFYGMKLKLERTESIFLGIYEETDILDILREECEELSNKGQLPIDQRSILYTPIIISEMQEISNIKY